MLKGNETQELAQSLFPGPEAFSPTATAHLEPASIRDLRSLAASLESSSRAPGLVPGERVRLEMHAQHALLVAVKVDPHTGRKGKREAVSRGRLRLSRLHRRQQDVGFVMPGFRVGPSTWSQYDEDNRPGPGGSVDMSQSRGARQ